jgi:hypothetical protein
MNRAPESCQEFRRYLREKYGLNQGDWCDRADVTGGEQCVEITSTPNP